MGIASAMRLPLRLERTILTTLALIFVFGMHMGFFPADMVLLTALNGSDATRTVYVVRHAERHGCHGCLNETGLARADNLMKVFDGTRLTVPAQIFAYRYNDPTDLLDDDHSGRDCERCVQTATPLADHLSLVVNDKYGYKRTAGLGGNEQAVEAINEQAAEALKAAAMAGPVGSAVL